MSRAPLRTVHPRFILCLPYALSLALAACGGEDQGRVSGGVGAGDLLPPVDHCEVASGYDLQPMVDFEPRGMARGAACDPEFLSLIGQTKCGTGFNYDSPNTPGSVIPVCGFEAVCTDTTSDIHPSMGTLPGDPLPEDRCGQPGTALHILETNVATCYNVLGRPGWGSSIELNFTQAGGKGSADLSSWDGISFWVKRNNPNTGASIIFLGVDPDTDTGACVSEDTNATCGFRPDDMLFKPDGEKCDPFSSPIFLSDEWTFMPIRFENMKQKGFGKPSSTGKFDTTHVIRFQFLTASGDWDFWIDDLALFRDP